MKKSYEYESDGKKLKKLLRAADEMMALLYEAHRACKTPGRYVKTVVKYELLRLDVAGPKILRSLLALADVRVTLKEIEKWSPQQRLEVQNWAGAVHASASDNGNRVPPRPKFLPNRPMPDNDDWMNRIHRGEHIKKKR